MNVIASSLVLIGLAMSAPVISERETRTGFLIPSSCQPRTEGEPQPDGSSDAWPAPHTTACALAPACIQSGYGLWVKDRFYRLDERGQELALAYFETTARTSYNKVAVTGEFSDGVAKVRFIRTVE